MSAGLSLTLKFLWKLEQEKNLELYWPFWLMKKIPLFIKQKAKQLYSETEILKGFRLFTNLFNKAFLLLEKKLFDSFVFFQLVQLRLRMSCVVFITVMIKMFITNCFQILSLS